MRNKISIGDIVRIKGTGQEAVVVATAIKFRGYKFVKCYEVMYQLPDKKMNFIYSLHPDSITKLVYR